MTDIINMLENNAHKECEKALKERTILYAKNLVKEVEKAESLDDYDMAYDIAIECQGAMDILWRLKRGRLEIKASGAEKKVLTSHKPSATIEV